MAVIAKMDDLPVQPWITTGVWLVIVAGIAIAVVRWRKKGR